MRVWTNFFFEKSVFVKHPNIGLNRDNPHFRYLGPRVMQKYEIRDENIKVLQD